MAPEHATRCYERENNVLEMRHILRGGCWAGPDVHTMDRITLPATSSLINVPICITPGSLPPLSMCTEDVLHLFHWSVRSILAQQGMNIEGIQMDTTPGDWLAFTKKQRPLTAHALIQNLSFRPIDIPAGTGIFRFFSDASITKRLEGRSLMSAIQTLDIQIEGLVLQKGSIEPPFFWIYAPNKPIAQSYIIGIRIPLNPEWHHYFPPSDAPTGILVDSESFIDTRPRIAALLTPVPDNIDRDIFWLGQTPPVHLTQKVAGILSKRPSNNSQPTGLHTSSRYIEPLRTQFPIVVEICGPSRPNLRPTHVSMYFVQAHTAL